MGALTRLDCLDVRHWRNAALETLRTPFILTEEMQDDFYEKVISNRHASHRYFALRAPDGGLAAMVGLTDIQWENGRAEISLIVDPLHRRSGVGAESVKLLLLEAFDRMRLAHVHGECYACNASAMAFWSKQVEQWGGFSVLLPARKFHDGAFHAGLYFDFSAKVLQ